MTVHERFTLRNMYLYLVCLITLVISIFAAVQVVRNVVELAYPSPGGYFEYRDPKLSDAERERRADQQRDAERRQAVLGLVGPSTTLLIAGPLYGYHWRKVQREMRTRATQPAGGEPPPT